jgi:hypothetical protein
MKDETYASPHYTVFSIFVSHYAMYCRLHVKCVVLYDSSSLMAIAWLCICVDSCPERAACCEKSEKASAMMYASTSETIPPELLCCRDDMNSAARYLQVMGKSNCLSQSRVCLWWQIRKCVIQFSVGTADVGA